jgi:hypothetical protein
MNRTILVAAALTLLSLVGAAQSPPGLAGVWVPMGGGRGADPKLAPPPAGPIVLKPEYAKDWEARRQADAERTKRGEPPVSAAVLCSPYGMPRMMSVASYPVEIIQTPAQITLVTEAFSEVRRVYMNEPQQPIDEVPPGYYGHSVGRWEGDTLVIDSVGFNERFWMNRDGIPHTDRLHLIERYTRPDHDTHEYRVTIDDPGAFNDTWSTGFDLGWRDGEIWEYVCQDNNSFADNIVDSFGEPEPPSRIVP